jgi:hypothetical protein
MKKILTKEVLNITQEAIEIIFSDLFNSGFITKPKKKNRTKNREAITMKFSSNN